MDDNKRMRFLKIGFYTFFIAFTISTSLAFANKNNLPIDNRMSNTTEISKRLNNQTPDFNLFLATSQFFFTETLCVISGFTFGWLSIVPALLITPYLSYDNLGFASKIVNGPMALIMSLVQWSITSVGYFGGAVFGIYFIGEIFGQSCDWNLTMSLIALSSLIVSLAHCVESSTKMAHPDKWLSAYPVYSILPALVGTIFFNATRRHPKRTTIGLGTNYNHYNQSIELAIIFNF